MSIEFGQLRGRTGHKPILIFAQAASDAGGSANGRKCPIAAIDTRLALYVFSVCHAAASIGSYSGD